MASPTPAAPSPVYQLEAAISDAFTFIRSCEANQALATVSLDSLIQDQIARNGTSQASQASKYDPYSYDPSKATPASTTPVAPGNFAGGSDTARPTKMDRITALMNNIQGVVDAIMAMPPVEVADPSAYSNGAASSGSK